MARIGSFAGPSIQFGEPVSVVHPADNNVLASRYHKAILDSNLNLTQEQREALQREIDELYALLRVARDYRF